MLDDVILLGIFCHQARKKSVNIFEKLFRIDFGFSNASYSFMLFFNLNLIICISNSCINSQPLLVLIVLNYLLPFTQIPLKLFTATFRVGYAFCYYIVKRIFKTCKFYILKRFNSFFLSLKFHLWKKFTIRTSHLYSIKQIMQFTRFICLNMKTCNGFVHIKQQNKITNYSFCCFQSVYTGGIKISFMYL